MKSKISFCILLMLTTAVFAQHSHGSGESHASPASKKETAHPHRGVPELQAQLRNVFASSLVLKDALVASDAAGASGSANEVKAALSKVDLSLLKDEELMDWMAYLKTLNESLDVIGAKNELSDQRKAFSFFSDALYNSLREFGTGGLTVYYDYCPMANNNAGAYWLSDKKEIENPYLGSSIPACGKLKETLRQ